MTINTRVLDYFEKNIRIFNARLEVYITTKQDLATYQFFCERLSKIYSKQELSGIVFDNSSWEQIETQLQTYKRQKGVVIIIHNQQPRGKGCQILIGNLFLACLYRWAQQNMK